MGEFILEMIIEPVVYYVFAIPGAFFRFLVAKIWASKKSFNEYLKDEVVTNGIVGLILFIILGIIVANTN